MMVVNSLNHKSVISFILLYVYVYIYIYIYTLSHTEIIWLSK